MSDFLKKPDEPGRQAEADVSAAAEEALHPSRLPVGRSIGAGILMGMANLVPGISGGTMILVCGLYDEFVTSVADVTRLKITPRNIVFLGLVGGAAAVTIVLLAGLLKSLVAQYPAAMYSLFIGMTLGGAPLLIKVLRPARGPSLFTMPLGLGLMILLAATDRENPEPALPPATAAATTTSAATEESPTNPQELTQEMTPSYGRDVLAGVLGMSAMVLPGISGAYMLLIIGRYTTILGAVSELKTILPSLGREGDVAGCLHILTPVAIGAVISLIGLSNLLKWLLHHHEEPTLGFLLGILLGSVIGIWPFNAETTAPQYGLGIGLAAAGFIATLGLSRLRT